MTCRLREGKEELDNLKVLDKAEVGRKLAQVRNEIVTKSSKLNKLTMIPIILCLEDAIENCHGPFIKNAIVENHFEFKTEQELLILKTLVKLYEQTDNSISSIRSNGFSGRNFNIDTPDF